MHSNVTKMMGYEKNRRVTYDLTHQSIHHHERLLYFAKIRQTDRHTRTPTYLHTYMFGSEMKQHGNGL